jgi:NADH:ubiquinone oxidoreductase subunit 6 (subunit J)
VYRFIYIIWSITDNILYYVSSKTWDANIATDNSHITSIGNIIYSNYSLWILLVSLILLLAMVGTITIVINPEAH